jgi:hypothetical protein
MCPGVADIFWSEVQFDCPEYGKATEWMLAVLRQRGPMTISDLSCNDLEFHAHEAFDSDVETLRDLLRREFDDTVTCALDHNALALPDDRALREEAVASGREPLLSEGVLGLFLRHGILDPEGVRRGIISEMRCESGKTSVVLDYRKAAGRAPHVFVVSKVNGELSLEDLWQIAERLVPFEARGPEISRDQAKQNSHFCIVPDIDPNEAISRYFENGYAINVIGKQGGPFTLRIDHPKT